MIVWSDVLLGLVASKGGRLFRKGGSRFLLLHQSSHFLVGICIAPLELNSSRNCWCWWCACDGNHVSSSKMFHCTTPGECVMTVVCPQLSPASCHQDQLHSPRSTSSVLSFGIRPCFPCCGSHAFSATARRQHRISHPEIGNQPETSMKSTGWWIDMWNYFTQKFTAIHILIFTQILDCGEVKFYVTDGHRSCPGWSAFVPALGHPRHLRSGTRNAWWRHVWESYIWYIYI